VTRVAEPCALINEQLGALLLLHLMMMMRRRRKMKTILMVR
jgi:hypothetical protein